MDEHEDDYLRHFCEGSLWRAKPPFIMHVTHPEGSLVITGEHLLMLCQIECESNWFHGLILGRKTGKPLCELSGCGEKELGAHFECVQKRSRASKAKAMELWQQWRLTHGRDDTWTVTATYQKMLW